MHVYSGVCGWPWQSISIVPWTSISFGIIVLSLRLLESVPELSITEPSMDVVVKLLPGGEQNAQIYRLEAAYQGVYPRGALVLDREIRLTMRSRFAGNCNENAIVALLCFLFLQ
jgi:hypothetical protein